MVQSQAATVDAYLAEAASARADELRRLRQLALRILHDHEETMTWGRPTYVRRGRATFGFAEQKQYVSLYFADPAPLARHAPPLTGVSRGKGCLRFRKSARIDWAVVERLLLEARQLEAA